MNCTLTVLTVCKYGRHDGFSVVRMKHYDCRAASVKNLSMSADFTVTFSHFYHADVCSGVNYLMHRHSGSSERWQHPYPGCFCFIFVQSEEKETRCPSLYTVNSQHRTLPASSCKLKPWVSINKTLHILIQWPDPMNLCPAEDLKVLLYLHLLSK